ncbi:MAG: methionine--tRNA ligase [Smithellaceae bacterium]|nr:methionine--tRNA ligase [Smithellaceae bacterium]
MDKVFYITTPIYYVNASPHLGHAYTTIVADVLARYHRLKGYDTFFCTGTDEHGDKIVEAAVRSGIEPAAYADRISSQFRELWPQLAITNDYFIRTTDKNHIDTVRGILQKVYDAGDIYFGSYEGYYCVGCERFYTEKELLDGNCPDHQLPPEYRKESNYFFRMSKYQDWLIGHIKENPDFIRQERYRNEALAFLREPLEDLCISRPKTRLTWGITLPFDDNYVTYVWFDALINYVTALGYPEGANFRTYWPVAEHLIAKDILKPHGIYWSTMLKAAGIEPYRHLNVHGYWNIDQSKMSKAVGNIVKPLDLKDKYGLDPFRYFLMRDMVFGLDSGFSEDAFVQRINSDLANDLGNLVSRSLTMAVRYCNGRVPERQGSPGEHHTLPERASTLLSEYEAAFEELAFHKALMAIWDFVNLANKYIVAQEPWVLARDPDRRGILEEVIYNILEALRVTAVLVAPFMPESSGKILEQLGMKAAGSSDYETLKSWGGLPSGNEIKIAGALFPRVQTDKEARQDNEKEPRPMTLKDEITYEEFQRMDLRVAKILQAEAVPKSKKLVKLKIDFGEERTIVAGIGADYSPAELVGKNIVILANLKPAKLMGIESQGMLLAVEGEEKLSLLSYDRPPKIGAGVK